jgi:protein tyrosine phosphatase (PTP) superfamily phosphohydrolase (DUF442 family)
VPVAVQTRYTDAVDALPGFYSYWVEPGVLLAGEYPGAHHPVQVERRLVSLVVSAGVREFVDLTQTDEPLSPYEEELAAVATRAGVDVAYRRFPIRDMDVPRTVAEMRVILDVIAEARRAERPVYVHCWGGVGRTATVVGCLLREGGYDGVAALARIQELRTGSSREQWESPQTAGQRAWIQQWASA